MPTTEQEIESFARLAKEQLRGQGENRTIDELFDLWRLRHPLSTDAAAIEASIRDMKEGKAGRPFADFAEEFRDRDGRPIAP
jgi:hypothetical protein